MYIANISSGCGLAVELVVRKGFASTVRDILLHWIYMDIFMYVYMEYFTFAIQHMLVHDVNVCLNCSRN